VTQLVEAEVPRAAGPPSGLAPRRRRPDAWLLLLLVPVAYVLVIFAFPGLEMVRRSFTEFLRPDESGFANYQWFFGDDAQMTILRRTITTSLLTTVICLALGFPFAYLMTVVGMRWRLTLLAVVLMPFWTSLIVRTYSWIVLLQDAGPINDALGWVGLGPVRLIGSTTGVVIGTSQLMLPFMVLPLYAALARIDRTLLLAAQGLGAPPRVAFARVYMPLAVPGVLAGSLIVFVFSLGFYFTPALLGSPKNSLISAQIVTQIQKLLAFGRAGAMALVLLVLTLVLLWIGARLSRRYTSALGIGEE
jgi:putative spermidine/putrescine transport system permease protein